MFTETVNVTGRLKIAHFDESGKEKDVREVKNLVVAIGKKCYYFEISRQHYSYS